MPRILFIVVFRTRLGDSTVS